MASMEMAGFTFDRERIGKILAEIERRKQTKRDYVGDTRKLRATASDNQFCLGFADTTELHSFTRTGQNQLAAALDVPTGFFNRLASEPRHQRALADMANHLLAADPQTRLVRTLDNKVRAVLSTRYRTLDNADLFFLAADEFRKAGAEVWEARLTDDSMRLYAVQPGIAAEVDDRPDGGISGRRWEPGQEDDGQGGQRDRHVAAVCIQNSETGCGSLRVRPCTLRLVCQNFNVWDETLTQVHLGRKREEEGWLSEDTRRLEDRVIWGKVRDIIRTAFDPKRFAEIMNKLKAAKADVAPDPIKAVDAAVNFCGLPLEGMDAIRSKFIGDKDFTRYGLVQAVTWQAHEGTDEGRNLYDDAGAKLLATTMSTLVR